MTRLIDELLDVSRIQSGALAFYEELVDLRGLVEDVVGSLELSAPDFTFSMELPPTPVTVSADRQRMEQVLYNLLQNAVKYSGNSRLVEVSVAVSGDEVVTSVQDYGVGIPAEQQSQVFERFFRGSNVETRHYAGLGLGLFISRSIVARHGGRMWLRSVEGEGSTFYFALPVAKGVGC